ncbi:Asp-tRNA(Asn)/Glu-tRNA(Gln) amidotransferase subunit GatA [Lactobacillus iners]|uniref:Asp-tRNA(Asn)/Glu-tRNA(Gln) amidotransferase subunit GatA n=1 Tax=Lactobacillus iners TaxID=147802 RepID=UPI0013E1E696|nr:Asp-tRNA(Asn)/Glu-tRNA(Gln) amidotransferase subunit GatA [Lactobacillus iners]QIH22848.1 Asp-tRNA(Asn)/Glu-tRNA(Gln) amidotransferase subunit GatA [Lactobacillus iners]
MNYLNETIESLNKKLKNKEITAEQLTQDTLAKIKELEPKLNAMITVIDDAKPAENLDFSNELAGIPIAVKDNIITNNVKTTAASHILYNYMPVYDATVVSKLKAAKMTIIGKTNMDEFAMGSSSENSYFGAPKNPWDLTKVTGGSSGGSAAAVAGGEVIAALGTDTGGSIRQPAAFNGIFGIKPTYGRVSRWGLIAFGSSLDQIGVMTKRVQDSAKILNVLSGADDHDATVSEREVPDFTKALNQDVKGLRVAVPEEYFGEGISEKVKALIKEQIKVLEDHGAIINKVSLPHTKYVIPDYYIIASSEASSNLQRFDGIRYGYRSKDAKNLLDVYVKSRSEGFGDEVKRRIMLGSFALSAGSYDRFFRQAAKVRTLICRDFEKIFEENDVIVGPTTPTPAFGLNSKTKYPLEMYANDILTIAANLAGVPAASVPAGLVDGMPVGLQIMAKRFDEESIFRVADFIERSNKFYEKKPTGLED